jgi:intracellular septation protein
MTETTKPQLNPILKLALDLGPLVLFFFANSRYGIFVATATFMVAVLAALAASYVLTRQLPIMPVVTAVIVLVFGGLTLILHNDLFIKIKPTILYALFGAVLLGGLFFGKSFLGVVFDSLFHLTEGPCSFSRSPCSTRSSGATSRPMSGSTSKCSASCR